MKLILLICLIATAMSATTLTTGTATLWTLTYMTPAATTTIYNLTLAYSTGATTGSTTVNAASAEIGVICITTTSNFTLADGATSQAGFAFASVAGAGGPATIDAVTNWAALTLFTMTALTKTTDIQIITTTTGTACVLTSAATPTYASFVHTYTFSAVATCTGLGIQGATWYARCFHKATSATLLSTAATFVVSAAKNVTVQASTFAAGATILAGIAYLQF
jgi:hypothetical protein